MITLQQKGLVVALFFICITLVTLLTLLMTILYWCTGYRTCWCFRPLSMSTAKFCKCWLFDGPMHDLRQCKLMTAAVKPGVQELPCAEYSRSKLDIDTLQIRCILVIQMNPGSPLNCLKDAGVSSRSSYILDTGACRSTIIAKGNPRTMTVTRGPPLLGSTPSLKVNF